MKTEDPLNNTIINLDKIAFLRNALDYRDCRFYGDKVPKGTYLYFDELYLSA
ncbi:hypothetical protein [Elizabethkingia ursingii]|uniref:hypothetical protein n=1 Tax=Elizabethkingia ursingii TaxID=1756150 RepID=UPI00201361AD|nr:hypothetical protein [Elizabethkingia ursingii]MCL1670616.1 hypothetical protein [Elizabethkingia ursingii]